MKIWGKILGFMFGWALMRLPGALIGLWIGHQFDKGLARDFSRTGGFSRIFNEGGGLRRQATYFYSLYSVMGHMAKSTGRVTEADIRLATALMDQMGLRGEPRKQAQRAFNEGKMAGFPLKSKLQELKAACYGRHDVLQMFLEIQIQAALLDGQIQQEERQILSIIASELGFSQTQLQQLMSMWQAEFRFRQQGGHASAVDIEQQLENAYKILGIAAGEDDKALKKRYRKLMSEHHPDKLVAKGLPEEAMTLAKQKTQDIQAAYDLIKRQRQNL